MLGGLNYDFIRKCTSSAPGRRKARNLIRISHWFFLLVVVSVRFFLSIRIVAIGPCCATGIPSRGFSLFYRTSPIAHQSLLMVEEGVRHILCLGDIVITMDFALPSYSL